MSTLRRTIDRGRRQVSQRLDQGFALLSHRLRPALRVTWHGKVRFALLTVNYDTTRYLKLMLLTLGELDHLDLLDRLVIVDQNSRDGGQSFLAGLAQRCSRCSVVHRRWWLHHAPGMRAAIGSLDDEDRSREKDQMPTVLLHVDPDVIFRDKGTLQALAACFDEPDVAFAGELRTHLFPLPEAQASFLAVRRDWAARPDISPWVHHGSPAWWQQRDCWDTGARGADFPSNRAGYALHRGRTAVASAGLHRPWSAYASVREADAHFMGVAGGRRAWFDTEQRWAEWLAPERENALIERLAERFS